MIFSSSNKMTENKVSSISMKEGEIQSLPLEELMNLKISIANYLKCRKLKNRNNEFIGLYMKIIKEVNSRDNSSVGKVGLKKLIFETKNEKIQENKISASSVAVSTVGSEEKNEKKINDVQFLKRKFSFSESLLDLVIPSFLNDKLKNCINEKKEIISQETSEFDEEKSVKVNKKIKTKKFLKGKKNILKSDFDEGLFNYKVDLDLNNDDLVNDFIFPEVLTLKETEIKETLFNVVPEDLFFELE